MPFAESNDIQLYYEIYGWQRKTPLVLINGIGQWHAAWRRNVDALAQHFRVIAFDSRGVGSSSKPDAAYTLDMMAADTLGLLDALDIEQAHVLGHSLGGGIAMMMAHQAPHRVGKMVMVSTLYWGPKVTMPSPRAMQVIQDRSGPPLDLIRRGTAVSCAPGYEERDPQGFQMLIDMRFNSQQTPVLYGYHAGAGLAYFQQDHVASLTPPNPVLLLVGEHDEVAPPANSHAIAAAWPGSQTVIIPNAGHLVNIEQPQAFNQAVIEFLED